MNEKIEILKTTDAQQKTIDKEKETMTNSVNLVIKEILGDSAQVVNISVTELDIFFKFGHLDAEYLTSLSDYAKEVFNFKLYCICENSMSKYGGSEKGLFITYRDE